MAKKGMNIRYRSRKRERNKYKPELEDNNPVKSFLLTLISVLLFLGLMALMVWGMKKLGVFERGYTKPEKEETKIGYEYIPIGTVFNRAEKDYYVIFDDYSTNYSKNIYVDALISDSSDTFYKVDMSIKENAKYKGETANKKATKVSELSINDITLIKISNGKITTYLVGNEEIEGYFNK